MYNKLISRVRMWTVWICTQGKSGVFEVSALQEGLSFTTRCFLNVSKTKFHQKKTCVKNRPFLTHAAESVAVHDS